MDNYIAIAYFPIAIVSFIALAIWDTKYANEDDKLYNDLEGTFYFWFTVCWPLTYACIAMALVIVGCFAIGALIMWPIKGKFEL